MWCSSPAASSPRPKPHLEPAFEQRAGDAGDHADEELGLRQLTNEVLGSCGNDIPIKTSKPTRKGFAGATEWCI